MPAMSQAAGGSEGIPKMTTLLSEFRRVGKWATISTIRHLIQRQGVLVSESPHRITPNGLVDVPNPRTISNVVSGGQS